MRYKEIIWVVNLENIWGLSLSVTQEKHRLCSKRESFFFLISNKFIDVKKRETP